jgi:hypothetical protein
MRLLIPLLMVFLLLPARAAWLEGIRWFRHADYTRVVFDLSAPAEYRISERLKDGYVDVILQGDLTRRMAEEIAIQEGGVQFARQLRKTSTSLTWRIQVEGMVRVRHMALDEKPYKVAVDFYSAPAGKSTSTPKAPVQAKAKAETRPASGAKAKPAGTTKVQAKGGPAVPAKTAVSASHGAQDKPTPAKEPVKEKGSAGEARLEGLASDERRRVLVGELLLQLGDSAGAMPYLEQVASHAPSHAWTRFLLAQAYLSKGDQYRAQQLLEPLKGKAEWATLLEGVERRLHPPDAQGLVPGGEIREEDLSYFLNVLRQGAGLGTKDIYAKPEPPAPAGGGGGSMGLTLFLGALAGAGVFGGLEMRRRRLEKQRERQRILEDDSPRRPAPMFVGEDDADYGAVARRVREELDQVLHKEGSEHSDMESLGHPRPSRESAAPARLSLEEQVYRLADQKKSIVEIAEELNLGVDEVRLHLELREQAGTINNA